ncbi:MAG: dependent protein [Clostridia bacterium]|nr:dependent protein [Clostridia bacterium]
MSELAKRLAQVRERIAAAAKRAGRRPEDITLVGVTKTVPVEIIQEAVAAGLRDLGENRVQELVAKEPLIKGVNWHMIGHLQRNKVKQVLGKISLLHSLDSLALARELEKRAEAEGKSLEVLIEVNVGGEETKFGLPPAAVIPFIKEITNFPALKLRGLMTVAPLVDDPEKVRPVFRRMAALKREVEALKLPGVEMRYLSMGMTNDFEVAIEEGANMVRIGTAIFGPRLL